MSEDDIPEYEGFAKEEIPTSDPGVPEEVISATGRKKALRICVVCRRNFTETDSRIVCGRCGHYAHDVCSDMIDMVPTCNKCIARLNRWNPFFIAFASGFTLVMVPLAWHVVNAIKEFGAEVQLMSVGVMILLSSAVTWKLKRKFEERKL